MSFSIKRFPRLSDIMGALREALRGQCGSKEEIKGPFECKEGICYPIIRRVEGTKAPQPEGEPRIFPTQVEPPRTYPAQVDRGDPPREKYRSEPRKFDHRKDKRRGRRNFPYKHRNKQWPQKKREGRWKKKNFREEFTKDLQKPC